jgi:hypothetical protein
MKTNILLVVNKPLSSVIFAVEQLARIRFRRHIVALVDVHFAQESYTQREATLAIQRLAQQYGFVSYEVPNVHASVAFDEVINESLNPQQNDVFIFLEGDSFIETNRSDIALADSLHNNQPDNVVWSSLYGPNADALTPEQRQPLTLANGRSAFEPAIPLPVNVSAFKYSWLQSVGGLSWNGDGDFGDFVHGKLGEHKRAVLNDFVETDFLKQ